MSVERLRGIPGFDIDRVAAAAGEDPDVLRLENLDTDLRPPPAAVAATRAALEDDDANSYLPFTGRRELRQAAAAHVSRLSGVAYDPDGECVITAGGTEGLLNALLATLDPGDEAVLTDPTYAGMIQRVRLAGGVPRLVPFVRSGGARGRERVAGDRELRGPGKEARSARVGWPEWRLDLDSLEAEASRPRVRLLFLMNPSMPSGAVLTVEEWEAVARLCVARDLLLLYDAAMERILFDGRPYLHPAGLPGMAERTITVGSVSKEYRMIGWRVGWVVAPRALLADVARVGLYNVVTPPGIAQPGAAAALASPPGELRGAVAEWEARRDALVAELEGFGSVPAAGGWSMLLDVGALGLEADAASRRLLERGRIAATPMTRWGGPAAGRFIRLVFSNEPLPRLRGLGDRLRASLGG